MHKRNHNRSGAGADQRRVVESHARARDTQEPMLSGSLLTKRAIGAGSERPAGAAHAAISVAAPIAVQQRGRAPALQRPAAVIRCVAPAAVIRCCASVPDWFTPWDRSEAKVPRQPLAEGEGSRPFTRPLGADLQTSLSPCRPVPCFRARASPHPLHLTPLKGGPSLRSAVPQGQASSSLFRPALCAADAVLALGCAPA